MCWICVFGLSHLFNSIIISQTNEIPNCRNLQPSFTGLAPSLTENRLEKIATQQRVHDLQWLPFYHLRSSRLAISSRVILDPTHTNSLEIYRNQSFWIWLHFVPTKKINQRNLGKKVEHFSNLPSLIPGLPTAMVGARRWLIPMVKRQSIYRGIKFRWVWLTSPPFWSIQPPSMGVVFFLLLIGWLLYLTYSTTYFLGSRNI